MTISTKISSEKLAEISADTVWSDILKIRNRSPLIHNITNYVVMNTTANSILAIGASPVMAHAKAEMNDIVSIANALVINIGTLSDHWIESMKEAFIAANKKGIPIILDPVGVGATSYRTNTIKDLLSIGKPTIIRGNASEIKALAGESAQTKGVDSTSTSNTAIEAARSLSKKYDCVVCVSGEIDYIVQEDMDLGIAGGHSMMSKVTGLGCTATAIIGVFSAVSDSSFNAAAHAMIAMKTVGEMASEKAIGPGSFQVHFLDGLYTINKNDLQNRLKLEKKK